MATNGAYEIDPNSNLKDAWSPTLPATRPQQPAAKPQTQMSPLESIAATMYPNSQWGQMQNQTLQDQKAYDAQGRTQYQNAPPVNPREALQAQFYATQNTQDQQQQTWQQALQAYQQGMQGQQQAWQENQGRNEALMREGMGAQQTENARSQAQNEGLMREGLQTQQMEQEAVRQQNQQMMQQTQAELRRMFGLLRSGGEGSLQSMTSNLSSQLAGSYDRGRWDPAQYGSYFQGMLGSPTQLGGFYSGMQGPMDTSAQQGYGNMGNAMMSMQYQSPDYSAFMDPASMSTSWLLPGYSIMGDRNTPDLNQTYSQVGARGDTERSSAFGGANSSSWW